MPPTQDILPGVQRIAVLKAGGLGDLLFAMPALDALRTAYPQAEIMLLTSAAGEELLEGRPGPVDRALRVPPFEGERAKTPEGREAVERLCERMRLERLDLAVQLHGGGANSNPLVLALGARETVGLQADDAPALDRTLPYVYFQSEVMRCLEVVALAGARPVSLEPRVELTATDTAASQAVLPDDGRRLAVMHPGAGDRRRWWPAEKFAQVARLLDERDVRVAVIGTRGDAQAVAAVLAAAPRAEDLCGRLSLPALTGLLGRADVVVSNDSGPLHLAGAVGAPTVGIFWCGNVINAGPSTVERHRALAAWRLECPVCGADCMAEGCEHDASFVADVTVEDVAKSAFELLAARLPV